VVSLEVLGTPPCRIQLVVVVVGTYLPLHPSKDSFISNSLPSPCFFPSLKNNKTNFFVLPMILSSLMSIDQREFSFILMCIYGISFPSLTSLYWFSLLLKMASLTYKYGIPKMTPHTSNGTTSTTIHLGLHHFNPPPKEISYKRDNEVLYQRRKRLGAEQCV
jgi:hypothetical protein